MSSRPRVSIVVDSAASLPVEFRNLPDLYVVPMSLRMNGKEFLDGVDISPTDFYRAQRDSSSIATTSSPSPAAFVEAFADAGKTGNDILCLTVAARFSSSADSARAGAQQAAASIPNTRIEVLETGTAAGGEALVALEAWRTAQSGESLTEVMDAAREVMSRVRLLAYLDTLYYLWKGGRVPGVAHLATSLLKLKPLFELREGEVSNLARPRTRRRAATKLIRLMEERVQGDEVHATVIHADAADEAERLRLEISYVFKCEELFVSEFTPVMGTHTGPGMLGIAFWSR